MNNEELKELLLKSIEKMIGISYCPYFEKIGKSSYRIELRDYKDYFYPLITLLVHTNEEEKHQVELLIKKDTENFSKDKPYKRGEYDFRDVICYPTSIVRVKLEKLLLKRLEDIFP